MNETYPIVNWGSSHQMRVSGGPFRLSLLRDFMDELSKMPNDAEVEITQLIGGLGPDTTVIEVSTE